MRSGSLLITGGGRGIGAATAELAARRGIPVAVTYLSQSGAAHDLVKRIAAAGGNAVAYQADARDTAALPDLLDRIEDEMGPLCGLVNNAGIHGGLSALEELDAPRFHSVMDTNLTASLFHIQALAARWRKRGTGGAVVNLSSTVATFGGNKLLAYAASKAGLETATIALGRELGPDGIRVNCVAPGVIETDQLRAMPEERRKGQLATIPLGRFGTPEDVAKAILFLLSEEASYITGTTLTIHGGR